MNLKPRRVVILACLAAGCTALAGMEVNSTRSFRAWRRKYWSLVGRLHYSPVALAGFALLGWVNYWNLLGFHFKQRSMQARRCLPPES